jgi:cytoskeletal protein RodZ
MRLSNSSAHAALTGELVKTTNRLRLQGIGIKIPALILALLLAPLVYAQPQQSNAQSPQPTRQASQSAQASPATQNSQPAPASQSAPDGDNAPVPPMPPDPTESAAPSRDLLHYNRLPDTPAPDSLLPDSPGTVQSAQLETQQPAGAQQSTESQPAAAPSAQPAVPPLPAPLPKEPLGTAAAETVPTMGIAASRPAGAALAPGKQRRIRSFLIRTGVIVGAAAALGVTMALTEASPSKPPGAH